MSFFRSLGGAIGVAALGAVLASKVTSLVVARLARLSIPATALGGSSSGIPDLHTLPAPVAHLVEDSYGSGLGHVFLIAAPLMATRRHRHPVHQGGASAPAFRQRAVP